MFQNHTARTGELMNISSLNNPAVNNPTVNNGLLPQTNTANTSTQGSAIKVPQVNTSNSSSMEDRKQTALQIVNRTLTMAYEKISSRGQAASAEYETFEPLTAEKVAGNILGFIERRLQMDVAEGATQEELQARLEAGLSGFKKGFAEASEKLEALSLLSPEIKADIGKTYDLVLEGIDDLRSKFIQSTEVDTQPKSTQPANVIKTADSKATSEKLDVPDFLPAATSSYLGYGNYEYGRAREFSFELTTQEGDKITIKAASSEGLAVEAGRAGRGNNSVSALNASYSSSQSFSLSIEGDLNEEELGAINDLLGRVNDLASQFFEGNLDEAFDQAMNMGYDAEQIGSFSLNLAQAEIQQVTQAYQTFEPSRASGSSDPQQLADQLLPLGNFIKDLLASLDRAAAEFNEPKSLLSNMAENITGETEVDQQQGKRFRDFIEEIFALDLG
jgi:archaellum component FlaC